MAILNLAGNFEPTSTSGGNNLPQTSTRSEAQQTVVTEVPKLASEKIQQAAATKNTSQTTDSEQQPLRVKQEVIKDQIKQLQQFNQQIDRSLQFKVDDELGVTIVRVIDKETEELIRQFPPEELINLSRRLKDLNEQQASNSTPNNSGILLQEKV